MPGLKPLICCFSIAAVCCALLVAPSANATANAADEEHPHPAAGASADGAGEGAHEVNYDEPPLQFQPWLFLVSLAVFVGFLFVAKRLVWTPLIQGLDAREARVQQAHAGVEHARAEVERLAREHETRIAAAQEEVQAIVAAARREAETAKIEIVAAAEKETRELQEQAVAEIVAAKNQALDEMSSTVDAQTALATEHVLGFRLNG